MKAAIEWLKWAIDYPLELGMSDIEAKSLRKILPVLEAAEKEVVDLTEQTLAWFNSLVRWAKDHDREWHEGDNEAVKKIRALLRQRRTVSREQVDRWTLNIWNLTPNPQRAKEEIIKMLAELGYSIEEPKAGGEDKP